MLCLARAAKALTRASARVKGAALLTGLSAAVLGGAAADDGGSVPVRLEIANATGAGLECQALAAHWYSFPVYPVAPGAAVAFAFTFARGVVSVPGSRLPVEALYCGYAGRAWATRGDIPVRDVAARAAAGGGARVTCRASGESVACDGR
jgi:hypothetical protein